MGCDGKERCNCLGCQKENGLIAALLETPVQMPQKIIEPLDTALVCFRFETGDSDVPFWEVLMTVENCNTEILSDLEKDAPILTLLADEDSSFEEIAAFILEQKHLVFQEFQQPQSFAYFANIAI